MPFSILIACCNEAQRSDFISEIMIGEYLESNINYDCGGNNRTVGSVSRGTTKGKRFASSYIRLVGKNCFKVIEAASSLKLNLQNSAGHFKLSKIQVAVIRNNKRNE